MQTMLRRWLSVILTCALIFSLCVPVWAAESAAHAEAPLAAASVSEWEYHKDGNEIVLDKYTGSAEKVAVPAALNGFPVTKLEPYVFCDCIFLTEVTLPDSVVQLGEKVFSGCSKLKKVTFGSSLAAIDREAFLGCTALTEVLLPDSVTQIGISAFSGCSSLRRVVLPRHITEIGNGLFLGCQALQTIILPDGVSVIGLRAFEGSGLTSIRLPASVTNLADKAFRYCKDLQTVEFCGDAPVFGRNVFYSDTLTAFYPNKNTTWDTVVSQSYGGNVTWRTAEEPDSVIDLSLWKITLPKDLHLTYDGTPQTPSIILTDTTGATHDPKEFTLTFSDNVNAGMVTVTVSGAACQGSCSATFSIEPRSMDLVSVKDLDSAVYQPGVAWKPIPVVTDTLGGRSVTLKEGIDYTVSYRNNTTVGTASVTVTGCGNYQGNVTKTFSILAETPVAVPAVKGLSAVNSAKGITVKWSAVSGADGYFLYRKTGSNSWKQLKKIKKSSTVSFSDTSNIANGTRCQYKVCAYIGAAKGTASAVSVYRLTPVLLSGVSAARGGKITAKWKKNAAASGYQVQFSYYSNFSAYKSATTKGVGTLSATVSGLKKEKTCYVRVRPMKTSSGVTSYGAWSTVKQVKISA